MTTITSLTSPRKIDIPPLAGDTLVATAWLVLYLVILGIAVTSEMLSSAIEVAGLH
jgi:hypothetical protein